MQKKKFPKFIIPVTLIVVAIIVYLVIDLINKGNDNEIVLSGTIEAESTNLAAEISGKVTEIKFAEGDFIKSGESVFILDGTVLRAQRRIAEDALELARSAAVTADAAAATASANYESVLAAALLSAQATGNSEWIPNNPPGYNLPGGSFTSDELIAAAQKELEDSKQASSDAKTKLSDLLADPINAAFVEAENNLLEARFAAQAAYAVYDKATYGNNADLLSTSLETSNTASLTLTDAQTEYDKLKDTDSAVAIQDARVEVVLADARVTAAQQQLDKLYTGEHSLAVQAAEASKEQAQAAAVQAHQAVTQAEDNLALVNAQVDKLIVFSPMDGVVLTRSIEVGEVVAAGTTSIVIGRLDPLTITIYVPEDQFGKLAIGQTATLNVDAYPDETFTASITYISDQAEFTPRNVQTVESRKSTVYAVKLQVANPDGKLKPGMPADVTFAQ